MPGTFLKLLKSSYSISASTSTCVKYRLTRVCDRVLIRPRVKTSSCSSLSSLLSSTGFLVQKCLDAQRFIQAQVQKGPRGALRVISPGRVFQLMRYRKGIYYRCMVDGLCAIQILQRPSARGVTICEGVL